jgi:hypothetical protein
MVTNILVKFLNLKFHKNPFIGSHILTMRAGKQVERHGEADM